LRRSKWSVRLGLEHVFDLVLILAKDDAAKLSSKVRGELPGKGKELSTGIKLSGEEIGVKVDSAVRVLPGTTAEDVPKLITKPTDRACKG